VNGYLLLCVVLGVGGSVLVVGTALLMRRATLGERREKWQDQTTGPAGAMFNALFLASFALSVVISWQAYDHAKTDTSDESAALVAMYDDAAGLPDGDVLRGEIRDYANVVLNQEWPLMATGGSAPDADTLLRQMSDQVLGLPTDQDSVQATRSETIKELDAVGDARDQRLLDAKTALPIGLLACLVITAVVVLGHGLVAGSPHTAPSLVPLAVEAALVTSAVFIIFLIRRPYHGALDIGPDDIRLTLAHFTATT
jgi:hypothetical protein